MSQTLRQMLVLPAVALLAGCQLASVAVYKATGGPSTPALYTPLAEPMLVLAENYKSPGSPFVDAPQLARFTGDELTKHNVAPVIEASKLLDLQQKEGSNYRKMSVAAIGRAVGAKQVLYLDVTRASMDQIGDDMTRAELDVSVKIIDADTGAVRWPEETSAGYPLTSQTPYQKISENVNHMAIREAVARSTAKAVGRVLRTVKPDEE